MHNDEITLYKIIRQHIDITLFQSLTLKQNFNRYMKRVNVFYLANINNFIKTIHRFIEFKVITIKNGKFREVNQILNLYKRLEKFK